jgi:integrase
MLLFPHPRHGGITTDWYGQKEIPAICALAGITKKITPRAMRRTFQSLKEEAQVDRKIALSISGHHTDEMADHYHHVVAERQRAGLQRIVDLLALPSGDGKKDDGNGGGGEGGAQQAA